MSSYLLHTAVCDLLGCQYPVVLAGMGGVARSELVAAVTNAGGYAFLGMVREPPEHITAEIRAVREMTEREFGINIIPAATDTKLLDRQIDVCIEESVSSVCLFWDVREDVIRRLRQAGILVVHQVGGYDDAMAAQDAGVHALITQGIEAGGHVRATRPLREVLKRVLPMTQLPVLAAGGISDGEDIARVFGYGAQGVVVGSAFLVTEEAYAHDYHKQRILDSDRDETVLTDRFHINWPFGALTRVLPNSVTMGRDSEYQAETNRIEIGNDAGKPVYLYSTDSPLRTTTGNLEAMPAYAGQGAYRINHLMTAGTRLNSMVREAADLLRGDDRFWNEDNERSVSATGPGVGDEGKIEGLADSLNDLLDMEHTGARVLIRTMLEQDDNELRSLCCSIYSDKSRWCRLLMEWITRLGHTPVFQVGQLYSDAMAIDDPILRIRFMTRKQTRIVETLKTILTGVCSVQLQEDLQDMQTSHMTNITLANKFLESK